MSVKVTIFETNDQGEPTGKAVKNFPNCDSFGVTNGGDLMLVTTQEMQGGPNMPPNVVQKVGINKVAFACGTWIDVEVEESNITVVAPVPGTPQ